MLIDQIELTGNSAAIIGTAGEKTLTMPGTMIPVLGVVRWYIPNAIRVTSIVARLETAPSGANFRLAVRKNGISVGNSPLEITPGSYEAQYAPEDLVKNTANKDDYFTVDILQVGALAAGEDLTLQINYVNTREVV